MQHIFVIHSSPYANSKARDNLDIVLATAAFNDDITIVFINNGVYQLLKNQDTSSSGDKNIAKTLMAFTLYDIDNIYVDEASLKVRHIKKDSVIGNAKLIGKDDIKTLILNADKVTNLS